MSSSSATRVMSSKTTGRIVGALFLSAFFFYGGGTSVILMSNGEAAALPENADSLSQLCAGSVLLILNSVAVFTLGVLAFRILRTEHPRTAHAYLVTRTAEAVLLALAPLGTLALALFASGSDEPSQGGVARALVENSEALYWIAMIWLGIGSIFFCWALLRSHLLPRALAAYGIVAYAIFALGGLLELLAGYEVGLYLSFPGAGFEVSAGIYLLVKGFRPPAPVSSLPPRTQERAVATTIAGPWGAP